MADKATLVINGCDYNQPVVGHTRRIHAGNRETRYLSHSNVPHTA